MHVLVKIFKEYIDTMGRRHDLERQVNDWIWAMNKYPHFVIKQISYTHDGYHDRALILYEL